jgi:hypothetical protein
MASLTKLDRDTKAQFVAESENNNKRLITTTSVFCILKSFRIVTNDRNDCGLYYQTMIIANLA